jgi:hypothetical protein
MTTCRTDDETAPGGGRLGVRRLRDLLRAALRRAGLDLGVLVLCTVKVGRGWVFGGDARTCISQFGIW